MCKMCGNIVKIKLCKRILYSLVVLHMCDITLASPDGICNTMFLYDLRLLFLPALNVYFDHVIFNHPMQVKLSLL